MDLHQKIVIARKKKGLTQEQLAERTNVTVRTVQRLESGGSKPRAYTLQVIAKALDISFEELIQENTVDEPVKEQSSSYNEAGSRHTLQMLCLSCFSYLVVPFVHFLIPRRVLKKSGEQNPLVIGQAHKLIRRQLLWKAALWVIMILTVAWNIIMGLYFKKAMLINYLLPFFIMYGLNAVMISVDYWRIRKMNFNDQVTI